MRAGGQPLKNACTLSRGALTGRRHELASHRRCVHRPARMRAQTRLDTEVRTPHVTVVVCLPRAVWRRGRTASPVTLHRRIPCGSGAGAAAARERRGRLSLLRARRHAGQVDRGRALVLSPDFDLKRLPLLPWRGGDHACRHPSDAATDIALPAHCTGPPRARRGRQTLLSTALTHDNVGGCGVCARRVPVRSARACVARAQKCSPG